MCLPSLVKICNSLAAVTVGFITFALIVEEAVIAPEENSLSLLAIVKDEPPPEANKPIDLKLCALPCTSLLLFRTSASSSSVVIPVRSTVTELESAIVTVIEVIEDKSDEEIPN